ERVFFPQEATASLYRSAFELIVQGAADGWEGLIMCYGQTGSGKTHTCFGDDSSPGLALLAAQSLFELVRARPNSEFAIKVSLLEILDEKASDLLHSRSPVVFRSSSDVSPSAASSTRLVFHGLRELAVTCETDFVAALTAGLAERTVAANYRHRVSSRSHVVLRITLEAAHVLGADGGVPLAPVVTVGSFSLVDLAGSESASLNEQRAVAVNGAGINRSLLYLRQVVRALGAAGAGGAAPSLRNSLLTRLLAPALSGAASLAMICCL
ncbi:kinesin motor domain-containing protein, partial [Pavlovales sp. CCMP2436]